MLAEKGAIGLEVQDRVVDRRAVRLAFVDSDHQVDAGFPSRRAELLGDRARYDDSLVDEERVPLLVAVPDRPRVDPDRRAWDERLRERDELRPRRPPSSPSPWLWPAAC